MAVEIITRSRRIGAKLADVLVQETVILRDGVLVAALIEGDPLQYLLQLSLSQLQTMRERLRPLFGRQRHLQDVFDALLEYRGQVSLAGPAGVNPVAAR